MTDLHSVWQYCISYQRPESLSVPLGKNKEFFTSE
jgi:hypothetical protein